MGSKKRYARAPPANAHDSRPPPVSRGSPSVEYDGRAHHEGEAFASNDNARHAGLVAMGFDTISLTRRNLRNADEFGVIARSIAK